MVDVLPAPFGPRNPNASPGSTWKSMPSTATKFPKRLVMRVPWISGAGTRVDATVPAPRGASPFPACPAARRPRARIDGCGRPSNARSGSGCSPPAATRCGGRFERRSAIAGSPGHAGWEPQPFPFPPQPKIDTSSPWIDAADDGACPAHHPVKAKLDERHLPRAGRRELRPHPGRPLLPLGRCRRGRRPARRQALVQLAVSPARRQSSSPSVQFDGAGVDDALLGPQLGDHRRRHRGRRSTGP